MVSIFLYNVCHEIHELSFILFSFVSRQTQFTGIVKCFLYRLGRASLYYSYCRLHFIQGLGVIVHDIFGTQSSGRPILVFIV